jgi:hypothetical protein
MIDRLRSDELSHVLTNLPTPFLVRVFSRVSRFAMDAMRENSVWRQAAVTLSDMSLQLYTERIAPLVEDLTIVFPVGSPSARTTETIKQVNAACPLLRSLSLHNGTIDTDGANELVQLCRPSRGWAGLERLHLERAHLALDHWDTHTADWDTPEEIRAEREGRPAATPQQTPWLGGDGTEAAAAGGPVTWRLKELACVQCTGLQDNLVVQFGEAGFTGGERLILCYGHELSSMIGQATVIITIYGHTTLDSFSSIGQPICLRSLP